MTHASIIILAWQGMPYNAVYIDAVFAQTHVPFDGIVVDNASTYGTADLVAPSYLQARLIRNMRNAGLLRGAVWACE